MLAFSVSVLVERGDFNAVGIREAGIILVIFSNEEIGGAGNEVWVGIA